MNRFGLLRKLVEGKELTFDEAKTLGSTALAEKKFPFKYALGEMLENQGGHSYTFFTKSKNPLVVKIGPSDDLLRGYRIQRELKKRGRKVANPRGMFNVYNINGRFFETGFVMEYAKGKGLSNADIESPEFLIIQKKLEKEAKKMKNLGYKSYYEGSNYYDKHFSGQKPQNVLYDKKTGTITILDFDFDRLDTRKLYSNNEKGGKSK